ncbi:HEAT repeat domain-containing protein [Stigmatella sp. ncwal1]|uniref:HEAT repeat domain-containing protein n=1 Tax=Stigmatella ashevillensis TaxID=2995309 RepID=A0ABT5D480_9BACT|nr:HEAT repeat domain-containing protein [Stigmatella ashevillena]MDC0707042.1 HEAT repeat domain-containing protein [Stigmatella ashevillena]
MAKLLPLVVLLLLTGCASRAYQRAKEADTVEAYRAFLREHPQDTLAEAVQVRIEELEFAEARKLHTVVAYKRFLESYPEAAQARAASSLLEGLRFNAAKGANTVAGWRQFLADHPEGAQRDEAKRLLTEAERVELASTEDATQLASFLRGAEDDPRRLQVEERLDTQSFAQARASGATKLFAYLRDFPAGRHREEAKVSLLSLELEGLLVSGLLEEVEARLKTSPLGPQLPNWSARMVRARAEREARESREPLAQAVQAGYYLRDLGDLERALGAPDPLDRWEAAEELGQHVSVRALEPLLTAFRTGRNPLIRLRALESLQNVLRALPREVAEYEVASRLEGLRERASSAEVYLTVAALLDLTGQLELAATEYQRAFDAGAPDPVVLRRWVQLRQERRQPFSAAVAARQLALWALGVAREEGVSAEGGVPLASARQLCAAVENARFAADVISQVRQTATEFPEDLEGFGVLASDAVKLSEARLADAELLMRERNPHARVCRDRQVRERLDSAVKERTAALEAVGSKLPKMAPLLWALVKDRDPVPEVRAVAAARLSALKGQGN